MSMYNYLIYINLYFLLCCKNNYRKMSYYYYKFVLNNNNNIINILKYIFLLLSLFIFIK